MSLSKDYISNFLQSIVHMLSIVTHLELYLTQGGFYVGKPEPALCTVYLCAWTKTRPDSHWAVPIHCNYMVRLFKGKKHYIRLGSGQTGLFYANPNLSSGYRKAAQNPPYYGRAIFHPYLIGNCQFGQSRMHVTFFECADFLWSPKF